MENEQIYLIPGDLVRVKHKLDNRPVMLITEKVTTPFKTADGGVAMTFIGMRCIWFDKNQSRQEGVFSTKDLEKI